jgi:hypothetical protein
MFRAIKIQPNIPCEYICQHIQRLLNDYQKTKTSNNEMFLVIEIKEPTDNDSPIPKLTYNGSQG